MKEYQLNGLLLLVTEYAPVLFELGYEVRDCYWEHRQAGTGVHVHELYGRMITLLGCLRQHTTEYARTLAVAYLAWTPLHSQLPAYCYVEEALEASLSRLAQEVSTSHQGLNVRSLSAMYMAACRPSTEVRDVLKSHVGPTFIADTGNRLVDVLAVCSAGKLVWVAPVLTTSDRASGHRTHPSLVWPYLPELPQTLLRPGGVHFEYILCAALKQFMRPLTLQSQPDAYQMLVDSKVCDGLKPTSITQRQRRQHVELALDAAIANVMDANPDLRPRKKPRAKAKAPVGALAPVAAVPEARPKAKAKPRPKAAAKRQQPVSSTSTRGVEDVDGSSSTSDSEVPADTGIAFMTASGRGVSSSSSSASTSSSSSTTSTSSCSSSTTSSGSSEGSSLTSN